MLNSRKFFYALTLIGLLAMSAVNGFAQTCAVTSTPLALRPEGGAELTGDIVATCTPNVPANVSVLVSMSGAVVNTTTVNATATAGVVATGVLNSAIPNSISFSLTGASGPTITITGIRINASVLAPNSAVTATLIVTTGATVLPLNPNPTTVGYVLPSSFVFSINGGSVFTTAAGARTLPICTGASSVVAALRFTELFSGVLRTQANEGVGATTGTQVRFVLANIPAGVAVWVPNAAITTGANTLTPGTGIGTTNLDLTTVTTTYTAATGDTAYAGNYGQVTGEFFYTVTGDSINSVDTLNIPVIVKFTAASSSVGTGTATVQGTLGPIATSSFPRFVATGPTVNLFSTSPCSTSLLYPYVTNVTGFDTGVAIVNTSADPSAFNTVNQAGTCTLSFYGRNAEDSTAPLPSAVTTGSIAAGKLFAWSLNNGGDAAALSRTGFQGYVIAQCNFQLAHGYAFISDNGAKTIAHGYLALVLNQNSGSRVSGASIEALNN